ncbi:MAG: DNA-directed RNA polymerase subunit beta [bacterium]
MPTLSANRRLLSPQHFHRLEGLNLIRMQFDSFQRFVDVDLPELFEEVSPIDDFTGKNYELHFFDITYGKPKYKEAEALRKELTYSRPVYAKVRLVIKETGEIKEQEIYICDLPWMTEAGAFIVNGTERVVVNQLIRSPGSYFTQKERLSYGRYLYNAKIIPDRGAWVEVETNKKGVLTVKIDRKRKITVTAFLRALGYGNEDEISSLFEDVDIGEKRFIEITLEKDPSHSVEEGLLEVYRKLRPGEPATVDNAHQLINDLFFNYRRYSLGEVGRYKLNQRLNIETPNDKEHWILRRDDIVAVLRELIQLNNGLGDGDDIDHLGNRRIRGVGELVRNQFRIGLLRMERIVKERMSIIEPEKMSPQLLVNVKPIVAILQEFFGSSQLSQFMDQTNPVSELGHKRRLSALGPGGLSREQAGFEVRDVHNSHYGRICPIETPEGPNIGLINALASHAIVNKYGFIETPYRRVGHVVPNDGTSAANRTLSQAVEQGGKKLFAAGKKLTKDDAKKLLDVKELKEIPVVSFVSKDIDFFGALEEERFTIARVGKLDDETGEFLETRVEARIADKFIYEDIANIHYMDVASNQIVGVSASLIPFLEHDDANRALMGANMQRQAVPLIKPQAPIVGTGIEAKVAVDAFQVILAEEDGVIDEVDAEHIVLQGKKRYAYTLKKFLRTNQGTCINQSPIVSKGEKVKKGDPLCRSFSVDEGEIALGQNLLVAFMSFEGGNFEDAIVLSERLVRDDELSSVHVERFEIEVRDTKLGKEELTRDIPNVSEEALRNLDDDGLIRIGAIVEPGDVLVGKITPKGETELTPEEKLLRAIFGEKARDVKDSSLRLPNSFAGKVTEIRVISREQGDELPTGVEKIVQVYVAQKHKIAVGDKMAGRHGNKGVISKVLPIHDMPHLEDGTPVDIVLNPLGVPSRMNLGQLFETHLGWAAYKQGYKIASPVFDGVTLEQIHEQLTAAGLPTHGKSVLYDAKTGQRFNQQVTVGIIYMMKLHHLAEDKIHARSVGPYSLVTQQPLGGKTQFGGQRFGEMEVWALEAYGAANVLQEMLTIKSDDVFGRTKAYEAIVKGEEISQIGVPESFNVLVKELQSLGVSVHLQKHDGDKTIETMLEENSERDVDPDLIIAGGVPETIDDTEGDVVDDEDLMDDEDLEDMPDDVHDDLPAL